MVNLLHAHGFETTTASTVDEALRQYAEGEPPDMLTTCMYGIQGTGLDLGISIRKRDSRIAMIVYSGFVTSDMPSKVLHKGIGRFLELPFTLHAMHEAICESLAERGQTDKSEFARHCYGVFELTHPKVADK